MSSHCDTPFRGPSTTQHFVLLLGMTEKVAGGGHARE
jgi:hypothetical protein